MQTVPHIHLVATERSNQPECIEYKMGASCSSSPFVTFSSRTCSFTLSFSIEDHHWFSSNGFTGGSIQYSLLLSFCRFELPWFDFQKTVLWAGTSVTSTCKRDATFRLGLIFGAISCSIITYSVISVSIRNIRSYQVILGNIVLNPSYRHACSQGLLQYYPILPNITKSI